MSKYGVVGLGYVGLGLAVALGKKQHVYGYDISSTRVEGLRRHNDSNGLINAEELKQAQVVYTNDIQDIHDANFFIVAVPTPAYFYEIPNLEPLIEATKQVATVLKKGDIVVFESTVYPGTTEDICIPILEKHSHLKHGRDFGVGYSPERINPNDPIHTLKTITKIVSAENEKTLDVVKETYSQICDTVYPVSCIKAAEATKLLENTQRDVNIACMKEV